MTDIKNNDKLILETGISNINTDKSLSLLLYNLYLQYANNSFVYSYFGISITERLTLKMWHPNSWNALYITCFPSWKRTDTLDRCSVEGIDDIYYDLRVVRRFYLSLGFDLGHSINHRASIQWKSGSSTKYDRIWRNNGQLTE